MAREVLDVQKYPDLRQYPGRPAGAAVRRRRLDAAAADGRHASSPPPTPLADDVAREDEAARRRSPDPKVEADAVQHGRPTRRRAVRQRARASASTPIRRPRRSCRRPGTHHRQRAGAGRSTRRRTTRSARSTARGSRARRCSPAPARRARATSITGLPDARAGRTRSSRSRSSPSARAARRRADQEAAHRPVPAVERQHGRGLDALAARAVRLRVRHAASRGLQGAARATRSTSLILADDARIPVDGCGRRRRRGGRGGGGRRRRRRRRAPSRPEYAYALTPPTCRRSSSSSAAAARSSASTAPARSPSSSSSCRSRTSSRACGPRSSSCAARSSKCTTDPTHPVMAGMPEQAAVFVDGSPVFETQDGFKGTVLARYAGHRVAAAVRLSDRREVSCTARRRRWTCELDSGHVVLLGFRPQWRGQPFGTFRVLFNAALLRRR